MQNYPVGKASKHHLTFAAGDTFNFVATLINYMRLDISFELSALLEISRHISLKIQEGSHKNVLCCSQGVT